MRHALPLSIVLSLSLCLIACGDKGDGSTGAGTGGETGDDGGDEGGDEGGDDGGDEGGETGDDGGEDDTGDPPDDTEAKTLTIMLEDGANIAGLRIWPADREDASATTNLWGEVTLELEDDETEVCLGFVDDSGDWLCEDLIIDDTVDDADFFGQLEDYLVVDIDDTPDLVVGRVLDADGRTLVHRGAVSQDVEVSISDSSETVMANGAGWFVVQGTGTVTAEVGDTGKTVSAEASGEQMLLTYENSAPTFTGPPLVYNGTAYFRAGESLEVKTDGVLEDPDGDTVTTEVVWTADNKGYVLADDGRGGFTLAPLRLQSGKTTHLYGEADPGTEVTLCDGTELTVGDEGGWEADVVPEDDARCVVSMRTLPGHRWTHVVYTHGDSARVDPPDLEWDDEVVFDAGAGTELINADKSLQITIPAGGIRDAASGTRLKGEITLKYAMLAPEDGMPGEAFVETKAGTSRADEVAGLMLHLEDSSGNPVVIEADDAKITITVDEADVKGMEAVSLLELDTKEGGFTDGGNTTSASGGTISGNPSGWGDASLLTVANVAEDYGCIRLYVPGGGTKNAPIIQMVVNKALRNIPLSGVVTTIGMTSLTKGVELWVIDPATGNIIETVIVPVGLTAAVSQFPVPAPYSPCTDVTLPSAPPPGTFLTRKLVEAQYLPAGFAAGDVAEAYYKAIDPNDEMTTFEDWVDSVDWPDKLDTNGDFDPRRTGGDDAFAIYGNDGDLGFGREMHLRVWDDWDPGQTGEDPIIAMYTTNYASVGAAASAQTATSPGQGVVATVAMDFRPNPASGGAHYTRFYAFDPAGNRIGEIPLDDFGLKAMPDLCTNCHGGQPAAENQLTPSGSSLVYPTEGRMADGNGREPRFIPFAVETFGYHPAFTQAGQEAEFEVLNEVLYDTNITPEAAALITDWYADGTGIQDTEHVPTGWDSHPTNPNVDAEALYQDVVQPHCRSCHLSFNSFTDFTETTEVTGMGTYLNTLVCEAPTQMPHAQVTQANFYADIDAKLSFIDEMGESVGSSWTATECPN